MTTSTFILCRGLWMCHAVLCINDNNRQGGGGGGASIWRIPKTSSHCLVQKKRSWFQWQTFWKQKGNCVRTILVSFTCSTMVTGGGSKAAVLNFMFSVKHIWRWKYDAQLKDCTFVAEQLPGRRFHIQSPASGIAKIRWTRSLILNTAASWTLYPQERTTLLLY